MALKINSAMRNGLIENYKFVLESVSLYNGGTVPTNADAGTTGTLLVDINVDLYNGITWGAASNGTMKLQNTAIGTAVADGTATYARIRGNSGSAIIQTDNLGTALTSQIRLESLTISSAGTISLLACNLVFPEE